jgi:hypothetical protein
MGKTTGVEKSTGVKKSTAGGIEQQVRSAFPAGAISSVQILEYGDDPSVEPSETAVRVLIDRADRPAGPEGDEESVRTFEQANHAVIKKLRDELPAYIRWIEFRPDSPDGMAQSHGPILKIRGRRARGPQDEAAEELTPVMTRLGAEDLATVDTLINAGIGGSRAEVLRWALGRVRDNPAYGQLRERVHEIANLKAQF